MSYRGFVVILFIYTFVVLLPSGAQPAKDPLLEESYNIFYGQGDHLRKLIVAGKFDTAAKLFALYKDTFFKSKWEKYSKDLGVVAKHLNDRLELGLVKAHEAVRALSDSWPLPTDQWLKVAEARDRALKTLSEYKTLLLLQVPEFRSPQSSLLKRR